VPGLLTISQVANRYQINNRQVHELMEYGYLQVSQVLRNANGGLSYLFALEDLEAIDIYSALADLQDKKARLRGRFHSNAHFSKVLRAIHHYDRFLASIKDQPGEEVLRISFYLFHLNHYAKRYPQRSRELYGLKKRVIKKLYGEYRDIIQVCYLLGPDRKRIWLCDDCKESARNAGLSFVEYLKKGHYCPKCFVHSVDAEYYSLYEFIVSLGNYRFVFHLPRSSAWRWLKDRADLVQGRRETGPYEDCMYLYGRAASRIEEKSFPLPMIIETLSEYLNKS
jgi:hypothetical protein